MCTCNCRPTALCCTPLHGWDCTSWGCRCMQRSVRDVHGNCVSNVPYDGPVITSLAMANLFDPLTLVMFRAALQQHQQRRGR